jgi:hypothetical protein
MLMLSRNRATALFGGWLAVMAGAWFVVGRLFATPLGLGGFGAPVPTSQTGLVLLELALFTGLGSMIIALGGMALGRLSVRSVRDISYAQRSVDTYRPAPVTQERAAVAASEEGAEPMDEYRPAPAQRERLHRDWRHPFGGSRPVPH